MRAQTSIFLAIAEGVALGGTRLAHGWVTLRITDDQPDSGVTLFLREEQAANLAPRIREVFDRLEAGEDVGAMPL